MQWEIDTKNKVLTLNGYYHIDFDRLQENEDKDCNWFEHLATKYWSDPLDLLEAFTAAFDAAGLKASKQFYTNWEACVLRKAGSITYRGIRHIYEEKFYPNEGLVWQSPADFIDCDDMIDALVSGKKPEKTSQT